MWKNLYERVRSRTFNYSNRVWSSETVVMASLAVLVGASTGLGVALFREILDHVFDFNLNVVAQAIPVLILFLPISGGLLTALWMRFASLSGETGLGVSGIMEAVELHGGRVGLRGSIARIIGAILTVGFGGSAGPEDPSVQIGATIGSQLAQRLYLSEGRIKTLVGCGAAAGLSAAFNAPIAGVFFAIEIILGEFSGAAIGWVVLAAVAGGIVSQSILGSAPAFIIPAYELRSTAELGLYALLGVFAALVSATYIFLLGRLETFFEHWKFPNWLKPALGGLVVGLLAYFGSTAIMGPGYQTIGAVLAGQQTSALFLLMLVALKLIATPLTIGSGGQGGLFAPSLFLGAMLGAAFGLVAQTLFGNTVAPAEAYSLVGMGAVLGGAVRAPITGLMLPFEMTQDYRIILPLMFAVVVSTVVARVIQRDSVYTLKLKQRGVELRTRRDENLMRSIRIQDAMTPLNDLTTLRASDSIQTLTNAFEMTMHHGFCVLDDAGELFGVVTLADLERALAGGLQVKTAAEITTTHVVTVYADESLDDAMRQFGVMDVGRIPVVDRRNPKHVLGMLRRADIIAAYSHALVNQQQREHHYDRLRLEAASRAEMLEIKLEEGDAAAGKRIIELQLPEDTVIVSVRRGNRTLIPRGNTTLLAGDQLIALSAPQTHETLIEILKKEKTVA
jgi:CIC family chloride channel protein